jgi:pilus assembly protein CpaC
MKANSRSKGPGLRKLLSTLLATSAILGTTGTAGAQTQPAAPDAPFQNVVADSSGFGGQVAVPIGGSRILRFAQPIGRVMVGNPKVADVIPLGERTLYVLGKTTGPSSLTVMARAGGVPLATMDVRVGFDVANIGRSIHEVMPGEPVEATARGEGVVLTGALSSSAAAARAAAIAEQYAPGHVVNLTTIRTAEQVMLSVRVAEVSRTAMQQLGLNNFSALWDTTGALTLAPPVLNQDAVANLIGKATSGDWTFQALFDALEQRGFASTLAEPNLVALSGETAVFFAGGEYPIPVPQTGLSSNTITIEYKQYGVSVGFTPTVVGDTINLAVAPEVSALDPANSVVLQGFKIPALTTRRAKTTVELRNGQSFAIAGLLRREFTDGMKGIPGAQRAPVLGALFRSTSYQNNETEVVIIVTAHLAKPTTRQNLLAPTDLRQAPGEAELYTSGQLDKPLAPPPSRPAASVAQPPAAEPALPPPYTPVAPAAIVPAPSAPAPSTPTTVALAPAVPAPVAAPKPEREIQPAKAALATAPAPEPKVVAVAAPKPVSAAATNAEPAKPAAPAAQVVAAAAPPAKVQPPKAAPQPAPAPVAKVAVAAPSQAVAPKPVIGPAAAVAAKPAAPTSAQVLAAAAPVAKAPAIPPTITVVPNPVPVLASSLAPAKATPAAAPAIASSSVPAQAPQAAPPAKPAPPAVKVEEVAAASTPLVVAAATPVAAPTRDFKASPSFSAASLDDDDAPISTAR